MQGGLWMKNILLMILLYLLKTLLKLTGLQGLALMDNFKGLDITGSYGACKQEEGPLTRRGTGQSAGSLGSAEHAAGCRVSSSRASAPNSRQFRCATVGTASARAEPPPPAAAAA